MITNISKPSSSIANATKINIGETFDSVTTTFDTETRSFDEMRSTISNGAKAFGGLLWEFSVLPWELALPWSGTGGISNIAKP